MAQLIKLKDYVTRYEWDAYRYPSQYIRLKQENWKKLYDSWSEREVLAEDHLDSESSPTNFDRFKGLFQNEAERQTEPVKEQDFLPVTEKKLRQYFLNKLYPFQLKWATSTVSEVSFVDKGYEKDETLKYFLQRFPDIYLIMYLPVFNVQNTLIDGEIIIISPIGIEIVYLLEKEPNVTIMAGDERVWTMEAGSKQTKRLSPVIALKRTEQIITSILGSENIDFPVKKSVVSRTNNIVFSTEPYKIELVGKYQYEAWFKEKRRLSSPLKSDQLRVIEALLKHCQTNSVRRPEWEEDTNDFITNYGD